MAAVGSVTLLLLLGRCVSGPSRGCRLALDHLRDSIADGAWNVAENGLPEAKIRCASDTDIGQELRELERQVREHFAAARPTAEPAAANPQRDAAQARLDLAVAVWEAFARRPLKEQTKELWAEAIRESTSHGVGLQPPYEAQFSRLNQGLMRKHGARLINEEAIATGDDYAVLVPSADRVKCVLWGSQWIQETQGLRDMGFRKIRCAGSSYTSKLTGKLVEEPPKEWTVP